MLFFLRTLKFSVEFKQHRISENSLSNSVKNENTSSSVKITLTNLMVTTDYNFKNYNL